MPTRAIEFAIVPSSLGALLVAASNKGVCQVRFAEAGIDLKEELGREFPFAELRENPVRLEPWDVSGSRFQRRVWTALRSIPRGDTRTYSEVADSIGLPKGARAVARACASNPVAVAIPCHRVVGKRGELGGYRWGLERKRTLLQREKTGRGGSASASRGRGESPVAEVAASSPVGVDSARPAPVPPPL
jgi:AraC family transcriptional regulator of adaptative response/methylated-DNA-[protein]-cysteine methyltransferase